MLVEDRIDCRQRTALDEDRLTRPECRPIPRQRAGRQPILEMLDYSAVNERGAPLLGEDSAHA